MKMKNQGNENELEESIYIPDTSSKPDSKKSTAAAKGGWKENIASSIDDRFKIKVNKEENDSDSEIPFIPDLETEVVSVQENATVAPNVAVNQISTYKELNDELAKHSSLHQLGGDIDIKLLTSCLLPESELQEDTRAWSWDELFVDVKSQLYPEVVSSTQNNKNKPISAK